MIRHIKKGNWERCNVRGCGGTLGCVHRYIPFACPVCDSQMVEVTTTGYVFCSRHDDCYEASREKAKGKLKPMVDGEFIPDPPIPLSMYSVKDKMPEKQDKRRVLAYTPTDDIVIEWRVIAANLFAQVCKEATHWRYLDKPL